MPISVNAIKTGEQTFHPEWNGESFAVTYRPDLFTAKFQRQAREKSQQATTDADYAAWWLAQVVVSWEVAGEDGQILPLSEEWLSTQDVLPQRWLWWLIDQITADRLPKVGTSPNGKASGDTSSLV